jgi:hypothetical protein
MSTKNLTYFTFFLISIGYFTLFPGLLQANQIAVLPSIIEGKMSGSSGNSTSLKMDLEFAKLGRDIIENNFYSNVVLYSETDNKNDSNFKSICQTSRSHYVVLDHYYFPKDSIPSVLTKVHNCRTGISEQKEIKLSGFVIHSLEKHYLSLFKFLPKRTLQTNREVSSTPDLGYFIDATGTFSLEKLNLESLFKEQSRNPSGKVYTYAVLSNNLIQWKDGNFAFSGKSDTDRLLSHFNKFINHPVSNKDSSVQVILISPIHLKSSIPWVTGINQSRQSMKKTILIIPYTVSHIDYQNYKKLVNATNSYSIEPIAYREVGFIDGSMGFLSLKSGYLYLTKLDPAQNKDAYTNAERFSLEEQASPYDMKNIYQKLSDKKIVQEGSLKTTTIDLLKEILEKISNPSRSTSKRFLVKSGGQAFWVNANPRIQIQKREKYIMETEFFSDKSQTSGISNDSIRTEFHSSQYDYPKLLEYHPSEVKSIMDKYKLNSLRVFIPVSIEDMD